MVKSRDIGDGHLTFNRNPYNLYINPYYWVDDHPLLYGNNGSLDPIAHNMFQMAWGKKKTATLVTGWNLVMIPQGCACRFDLQARRQDVV